MDGIYGRILKVDLNTQTHRIVPLDEAVTKNYLGGKGLDSYLFYEYKSSRT